MKLGHLASFPLSIMYAGLGIKSRHLDVPSRELESYGLKMGIELDACGQWNYRPQLP